MTFIYLPYILEIMSFAYEEKDFKLRFKISAMVSRTAFFSLTIENDVSQKSLSLTNRQKKKSRGEKSGDMASWLVRETLINAILIFQETDPSAILWMQRQ